MGGIVRVSADAPLRVDSLFGDLADQKGRGAAGIDGVCRSVLLQLCQDAALDLDPIGAVFLDELGLCRSLTDIRGVADSGQIRLHLISGVYALLHQIAQVAGDPFPGLFQCPLVHIVNGHLTAVAGKQCGPACTDQARPDHRHLTDIIRFHHLI